MSQRRLAAWSALAALTIALAGAAEAPAQTTPQTPPAPLALAPLAQTAPLAPLAPVTSVEQLRFPPPPDYKVPQPQRIVLDNGLVLMLLEDHELPLVSVTALLRSGSRLDPASKLGLAEIAGDMMRTAGIERPGGSKPAKKSTHPGLSGEELDERLESHAATLDVGFAEDSGSATLGVLREDLASFLPIFAGVLRYPAFDDAKLDISKDFAKQRLARQNDDPDTVVWREFGRLVYGPRSVYGRTPTTATIDAITRTDLLTWHRQNVLPERTILGISGDFDSAAALAAVRAAFGDWQRGGAAPPAASAAAAPPASIAAATAAAAAAGLPASDPQRAPNPGLFVIDKGDMSQSNIVMGHLGVVKSDPDYFALQVLNEVLSGSFASRLMAHVRTEKGLAYAVDGAIASEWDHPGMATLSLSTKVSNTSAGIQALLAEARGLTQDPPTDQEVARARQSLLASFVFHADSAVKVLGQQMTLELFGYPLDWLSRYRAGLEAVTADAVRQAAARHLHADQFTILVLGPAESADASLAQFGKPTILPLAAAAPHAAR